MVNRRSSQLRSRVAKVNAQRPTTELSGGDTVVGTILRQARQQRELSIATVAQRLHIPAKYLQALEEGDMSVFSAEVYARGVFTKYADFLSVRATTTHRAFSRLLSGVHERVPLRVHSPRPWLLAMLTPNWFIAAAIVAVAVLLGSYIVWQVQSFWRLPDVTLVEPTSGVATQAAIMVRGQADIDATVVVNGEQALVTPAGAYEVPLVLHLGINPVRVEATNAAGRTRTIQRDVLLPRPGV